LYNIFNVYSSIYNLVQNKPLYHYAAIGGGEIRTFYYKKVQEFFTEYFYIFTITDNCLMLTAQRFTYALLKINHCHVTSTEK